MGSSFVEYRGKGFWTRDGLLEVWLELMSRESQSDPSAPDWLRAAASEWHEAATIGAVGCVAAGLDRILSDPTRIPIVETVTSRVLASLARHGSFLSVVYLTSLATGAPGDYWTRDVETELFVEVGRKWLALIRGELHTTAADG